MFATKSPRHRKVLGRQLLITAKWAKREHKEPVSHAYTTTATVTESEHANFDNVDCQLWADIGSGKSFRQNGSVKAAGF